MIFLLRKTIFIFFGIFSFSQNLPHSTLHVKVISQQEGLSQLGISAISFDSKGFLWAGTQNGLNRYNGYQMKTYFAEKNEHNLKDDHIRSLYYENDTLWMATNTHSINAFLPKQNKFLNFNQQANQLNEYLKYSYTIAASPRNIIVGAVGHCFTIDRKTLVFKTLKIPNILENDFVTSITELKKGLYLIGTNSSGIYWFDENQHKIYFDEAFTPIQNIQINSILKSNQQRVLIGTNKGLFEYHISQKKLFKINDILVKSLFRWDENTSFIGGLSKNYFLKNFRNIEEIKFIDNLTNVEIEATILTTKRDNLGGIFFGTETKGLFYYHPFQKKFSPNRIQVPNSPKKDFISIFNFLRQGENLWMATEMGFVNYNFKTKNYKLYRTDNLEYTLALDKKGNLWAGGFEGGLLRFDEKKDKFEKIPVPFKDSDVIQLTFVSEEKLWIHTWSNGIFEMNIRTGETHPLFIDGKKLVRSRISYIDHSGTIWIGSDEGLYNLNRGKIQYYGNLSNPRVFSIAEDRKGNIWVGTAKGLNKIDPAQLSVTKWERQNGLPNDFIYGVLVDNDDKVWVSTNYGISVFNQKTKEFKNYTEEDGLQNNEFNGKAAYKDSFGNFYFGGMNGLNIIQPEKILMNHEIGQTVIEDVKLFGKSIPQNTIYSDTLYFSHNENVISFDFVSLNFLRSEKNRYRFMLEGFDSDWRPETKERSTTYTNLNPGTYIFKVKGSNNELLWGEEDYLTIIILSPWYETTWFKLGMGLSFLFLIGMILYYKNLRQKKINQKLIQMVEERTAELNETNSALNKSLHTSKKQKENISFLMQELNHRVKNNLQLITSLIDLQAYDIEDQEIQNKLKLLQSRVYTVSKVHDLLNREDKQKVHTHKFIKELVKDIVLFSGQKIETEFNLPVFDFPIHQITYLGLIFNELVTNSIKHAFAENQLHKKVGVSGKLSETHIVFIYHDNGRGFNLNDMDLKSNKGMNLIFTLVKELKGQLIIHESENCLIEISIPIIKK